MIYQIIEYKYPILFNIKKNATNHHFNTVKLKLVLKSLKALAEDSSKIILYELILHVKFLSSKLICFIFLETVRFNKTLFLISVEFWHVVIKIVGHSLLEINYSHYFLQRFRFTDTQITINY